MYVRAVECITQYAAFATLFLIYNKLYHQHLFIYGFPDEMKNQRFNDITLQEICWIAYERVSWLNYARYRQVTNESFT